MNHEHTQAEYQELTEKIEALSLAYENLDNAVRIMRVCIDPQTSSESYKYIAQQKLGERCSSMIDVVESLAKIAEGL